MSTQQHSQKNLPIDPDLFNTASLPGISNLSDDLLPPPLNLSDNSDDSNIVAIVPPAASKTTTPKTIKKKKNKAPTLNTPASSQKPPSCAPKTPGSTQKPCEASPENEICKAPHIWTTIQKEKLLDLIAIEIAAGRDCDNGNLQRLGWTNVMNSFNKEFDLNLTRDQIRNQKNSIRSLYFDYKFLCNQSGFGWDIEKKMVTADPRAWSELIQEHPQHNFGKLKDKPFPLYELAEQVFTGTFATGEPAGKFLPPTEDPGTVGKASSSDLARKKQKQKTRSLVSSSSDNSDVELANDKPTDSSTAQASTTSSKRVRETKGSVLTKSIDSLIGAIHDASTTLANSNMQPSQPHSSGTSILSSVSYNQETIGERALRSLAENFYKTVDDANYVRFVFVLEDEKNASTFLSLMQTSKEICLKWLDQKVKSAESNI